MGYCKSEVGKGPDKEEKNKKSLFMSFFMFLFISLFTTVNPTSIKDPIKRNKANNQFVPQDYLKIRNEITCTS